MTGTEQTHCLRGNSEAKVKRLPGLWRQEAALTPKTWNYHFLKWQKRSETFQC